LHVFVVESFMCRQVLKQPGDSGTDTDNNNLVQVRKKTKQAVL